jgi:hypothetical protein
LKNDYKYGKKKGKVVEVPATKRAKYNKGDKEDNTQANTDQKAFHYLGKDRTQIRKMFLVYSRHQNVAEVAKECEIHRKTVKKYRDMFSWDEEIERVNAAQQMKLNAQLVDRRIRNTEALDTAINSIVTQLQPDAEGVANSMPLKSLPSLIKAQTEILDSASGGAKDEMTPQLQQALELVAAIGNTTLKLIADHLSRINFNVPPTLELSSPVPAEVRSQSGTDPF